jgi:glycosyltransferase involved in cell wall biosynthesis
VRVFLSGTSFHPSYGGPAISVARLATALASADVEVGLWSPDGSVINTPYLPGDSRVVRLHGPPQEALASFLPVNVIHDNGLWRPHNHKLAVIAEKLSVPRVVSTRGMLEPWAMRHKRWKKGLAWRLYQRGDLVRASGLHVTSTTERDHVRRLDLGVRIFLIPNGIDVPAYPHKGSRRAEPTTPEAYTALFLGRIYPVKGLPMLVDAWGKVRPAHWRLLIVGPDEAGHRAEVERHIAAAGLSGVVAFAGPLADEAKRVALTSADLLILPSYSESFGMAIAEGLAHGLPVLTTTGAPWPELAARACGWSVAPTVEGLVEGLRLAVSKNKSELDSMGQRGYQWMVADFSWDQVARKWIDHYRSVIGARGSAR